MPKKKSLPDHSNVGFSWAHEYFTEEKAIDFIERYGFKKDFDLYSELSGAIEMWQLQQNPGDFPLTARRKELDKLLQRTADLNESLLKLGRHACIGIIRADVPQDARLNLKTLSELRTIIRKLMWSTKRALKSLPDAKRGRRSSPEEELTLNLRRFYLAGTGKRDIVTRNSYDNNYSGNFFEFLRELLGVLGIKKSDSRVAALAQEAAKADNLMVMNKEEFDNYLKSSTLKTPN